MKVNSAKSHLFLSTNMNAIANVGNGYIESDNFNKIFGITIDAKLSFETVLINFAKRQTKTNL